MAFHIGDQELLDQYLSLPHLWPAEDWAMAQLPLDLPDGHYAYLLNPATAALTDLSVSAASLRYVLGHGRTAAHEATRSSYLQRGAVGSASGYVWAEHHLAKRDNLIKPS